MDKEIQLSAFERESVRSQAVKLARKRLEDKKPRLENYQGESVNRAFTHWITTTLDVSMISIPLIALLAAVASSIRTTQAIRELYTASDTPEALVWVAAFSITISVEGALFAFALASEQQKMKAIAENRPRQILTLLGMWDGIQVRVGLKPPRPYKDMEHSINFGLLTVIAFSFAVAANAYIGLRPLIHEAGEVSIQGFLANIWSASAELQLMFFVDVMATLFAPVVGLVGGHLSARLASDVVATSQVSQANYESDFLVWQASYNDPLATEEGISIFEGLMEDKLTAKRQRYSEKFGLNGSSNFLVPKNTEGVF